MTTARGSLFSLNVSDLPSTPSNRATDTHLTEHALNVQALESLEFSQEASNSEKASSQLPGGECSSSGEGGGATCLACGIGSTTAGFTSLEEQRAHFKTDWHRYNVRRRLAHLEAVTEDAFSALVENDDHDAVGSLSGSESDFSDIEEDEEDTTSSSSGPQFVFNTADGTRLSVWRSLIAADRGVGGDLTSASSCINALQTLHSKGGRWAVILFRGGHFSAAVYDIIPPKKAPAPGKAGPDVFKELLHKSFHRYVVRAKAGGKQSTKDASGKFARSAGARLRRYNEAALEKEITETLEAWSETLASCSVIFVQAVGSSSRTLFGGDNPPLKKADERIRKIPFVTRRPTLSEIKRVLRVLTTVYQLPAIVTVSDQQEKRIDAEDKLVAPDTSKKAGAVSNPNAAKEEVVVIDEELEEQVRQALKAEEAQRRKAEKRAKLKAKQKEQQRAEVEAGKQAALDAAKKAEEDEILRAATEMANLGMRPKQSKSKLASSSSANSSGKASAAPRRLNAKTEANEDPAIRRARLAAAAEARMQALQKASQDQKLW